MTTLDGKKYAMNGCGVYTMMDIPSQNFTLQARTGRAETKKGTLTNATVFVGFAVVEGDYPMFQVTLSSTSNTMVLFADDLDVTNDFYAQDNYSSSTGYMNIRCENRNNVTTVVAVFPWGKAGVSIKVSLGVKSLKLEMEVDKSLQDRTRGLLGNLNINKNDEFQLQDGTVLSQNLTEADFLSVCQNICFAS
ncbi:unnamed protein product [Lymnaea stagnalis]|uniref:VWFD domain-containing protein n=1 Tax=Lymnaea stagnalis TaxID=6523 RepID=A0AAV2ISV8_LYMST